MEDQRVAFRGTAAAPTADSEGGRAPPPAPIVAVRVARVYHFFERRQAGPTEGPRQSSCSRQILGA